MSSPPVPATSSSSSITSSAPSLIVGPTLNESKKDKDARRATMTPLQKHQDDLAYAALLKESKRAQAAKDAIQKKEDAKAAKVQAKTSAPAVAPACAAPAGKAAAATTGKAAAGKAPDTSAAKKAVVIAKKK